MSTIRSEVLGDPPTILVVYLPAQVVDDSAAAILSEVTARLPNTMGAGLVLDCSAVELVNSIGITCLLQVQDHCRRLNASMLLASMPPHIQLFLRQVKLDRRFTAAATVDDAVAQLSGR